MEKNQKNQSVIDKPTAKKSVSFNSESLEAFPPAIIEEKQNELDKENEGTLLY